MDEGLKCPASVLAHGDTSEEIVQTILIGWVDKNPGIVKRPITDIAVRHLLPLESAVIGSVESILL